MKRTYNNIRENYVKPTHSLRTLVHAAEGARTLTPHGTNECPSYPSNVLFAARGKFVHAIET